MQTKVNVSGAEIVELKHNLVGMRMQATQDQEG